MSSLFTSVLVEHVHGGGPAGPPPAGRPILSSVALYAGVIAVGMLLAPRLTGTQAPTRMRNPLTLAAGLVALATLVALRSAALGDLIGTGGAHRLLMVAHLLVAAVWVGGVIHLTLVASSSSTRPQLGPGMRRFTPVAVATASALALTGLVLLKV